MSGAGSPARWSGGDVLAAFAAASAWLGAHAAAVNALNVFPVPDGDTGTNMSLTMASAMEEARATTTNHAGEIAQAIAHGALMGARGNSGVILSQVLRGFARSLADLPDVDAAALAAAFREASNTAYRGVIKPVEGTILTVIRESADAAERSAESGAEIRRLLADTLAGAREAVAKTPTMLPVLKQAGVVDAGGQGLALMVEGLCRYACGEAAAAPTAPTADQLLDLAAEAHAAFGETDPDAVYGYCTEFVILGRELDLIAIRQELSAQGDSLLAVGDESTVRVHIHTYDPGRALSFAGGLGQLTKIKIDNMQLQHERFVGRSALANPSPTPAVAVRAGRADIIAVASGDGLRELFASLGATRVVAGGQTMNPSIQELLAAVEAASAEEVLLLPNNSNIVLTAKQVVGLTKKHLAVVPTQTVPQGIAAMFAYNFEADLEANAAAMGEAAATVRTVEVTRAVRSVTLNGVDVAAGAAIALVDGELALAGEQIDAVAVSALERVDLAASELVTIYRGAGVAADEASGLSRRILDTWPSVGVEIVDGGQPHYHYIIQVE